MRKSPSDRLIIRTFRFGVRFIFWIFNRTSGTKTAARRLQLRMTKLKTESIAWLATKAIRHMTSTVIPFCIPILFV